MSAAVDADRLAAWCAQVREIHEQHGTPVPEGDWRRALFDDIPDWADAEDIGGKLFRSALDDADLPCPLPVPAWADEAEVDEDDYPVMTVTFSLERTVGRATACAVATVSVAVDRGVYGKAVVLPGDILLDNRGNVQVELQPEAPMPLAVARDAHDALDAVLSRLEGAR